VAIDDAGLAIRGRRTVRDRRDHRFLLLLSSSRRLGAPML
jgi:hypothetical protein